MKKTTGIFLNSIPVLLMISLIPFIQKDYLLALTYIIIIGISFAIKYTKNDYMVMVFGFFIMMISEYLFISTGVETFVRNSLFGIMPVWLPLLWAYGFVAIRRSTEILDKQ